MGYARHEENVFGFEVAVDEPSFVEHGKRVEKLCGKDLDELGAEASKLVLFDKFVEIGRQELKHKTQMVFVDKLIAHAQNVVLVIRVPSGV